MDAIRNDSFGEQEHVPRPMLTETPISLILRKFSLVLIKNLIYRQTIDKLLRRYFYLFIKPLWLKEFIE